MKWKPGSPCSNATYEFLAPQFVLHYLGWKIEVVGWRNPKMQENARVGGSRCRSQRVGQKGKISKWELKKIVQQQLGYAFKQMKHCNKKIHQKCFSEMCKCTERMDKVRSVLQSSAMQWYKDWAYLTYGNVCNTFTTFLLGHMACGTFLWVIAMGWSLNDVAVSRFSFCCCFSLFILLLW